MKKLNSLFSTAVLALATAYSFAQAPTLPAASPAASVSQTFGITKISIEYHSPGVKGRTVWGNLVPYDSVWRTGANEATTINFSTGVMIGGTKVKAGKYALFTIPGKDMWTIIINSEADQWGSFDYHKSADVVRLTVKPMMSDFKERMSFYLDVASDSTCHVTLQWEKVKVSFDVQAATIAMTQKGVDNTWSTLANAANYYVDNKLDLNKALVWAQAALTLSGDHFYSRYVLARVLDAKGDKKEALKYAEDSKKIGASDKSGFYDEFKDKIEKMITDLGGATKK
jgi:DUF2911 family protein